MINILKIGHCHREISAAALHLSFCHGLRIAHSTLHIFHPQTKSEVTATTRVSLKSFVISCVQKEERVAFDASSVAISMGLPGFPYRGSC